jgi:hypothetical protein
MKRKQIAIRPDPDGWQIQIVAERWHTFTFRGCGSLRHVELLKRALQLGREPTTPTRMSSLFLLLLSVRQPRPIVCPRLLPPPRHGSTGSKVSLDRQLGR